MRKNILLVVLLLSYISGFALSSNSRISVLTSDPGIEYYTIFGHSAIRVTDDSLGIDRVYNFGTFDFREPFFYMKFIKGNLKYFLSISDFKTFMSYSYHEKRKIHEQVLDLNLIERSKIFNNLERCHNSPDRYYIYDFYYDNCATRVRNFIFKSTEQQILFNTYQYQNKTFRQLLRPYISGNYWIDFGINLVLGRESDKIARPEDYMFLPSYIMSILQTTSIVKEQKVILDASESTVKGYNYSYLSPWIIIVMLLLLSVWSKSRKIIFYTVTSVVGFTGLALLAIGFYTDNAAFSNNMNVLWTIPSILVILFSGKQINTFIEACYILLLVLLLLFRNNLPQELSTTFIPWMLCLILILLLNFNFMNKIKIKSLIVLFVILIYSNPAYCQTDTSDKKTSFNLDYGFKVTVGDEEDFGGFKTFTSFELSNNGKIIFVDKSNVEYEFGDKLYPIVMQTGKDSYELLFEINDRPSKNYLKRLIIKDNKLIHTDNLPTFVAKPKDINGDGVKEYAGFLDYAQIWGENNTLTAYNPILYYSVTKNGLKLDSLLTKERNVIIYGKFHGYDFSEKIEMPANVSKAFDAEIKLLSGN